MCGINGVERRHKSEKRLVFVNVAAKITFETVAANLHNSFEIEDNSEYQLKKRSSK